jgi:hypothetical protein
MSSKIVVIMLVGRQIFAWTQQDALKKQWQKYFKSQPNATQTAVYTWKDEDGTVHFSATPDHKNARLSIVDASKINSLEPLPEPQKAQAQEDKLLLLEVRDELEANRNKMQEEKERRVMQQ